MTRRFALLSVSGMLLLTRIAAAQGGQDEMSAEEFLVKARTMAGQQGGTRWQDWSGPEYLGPAEAMSLGLALLVGLAGLAVVAWVRSRRLRREAIAIAPGEYEKCPEVEGPLRRAPVLTLIVAFLVTPLLGTLTALLAEGVSLGPIPLMPVALALALVPPIVGAFSSRATAQGLVHVGMILGAPPEDVDTGGIPHPRILGALATIAALTPGAVVLAAGVLLPPPPLPEPVEPMPEATVSADSPRETPDDVEAREERPGETVADLPEDPVFEVRDRILRWATDWTSGDADEYLKHYSVDFDTGDDRSWSAWAVDRRLRVESKSSIQVRIEDLEIDVSSGGETATATFDQIYRDPEYADRVRKTMVLAYQLGRWRILRESSGDARRLPVEPLRGPAVVVAELEPRPGGRSVRTGAEIEPASAPNTSSDSVGTSAGTRREAETDPRPRDPAPAVLPPVRLGDVEAAVRSWVRAWNASDVVTYLAAYDPSYAPDGTTREAWEASRRERLARSTEIRVELSDLRIGIDDSTREARVEFVEDYWTPTFSDRVQKTLVMALRNGSWRIVDETSSPL